MEPASATGFLGALAHALWVLIKEHEPTKLFFGIFQSRMKLFASLINQKAPDEIQIVQTGSSFDDLHMCRNMKGLKDEQVFFPETDFDIMMMFKTFPVEDFTTFDERRDADKLAKMAKQSKCAAIMLPSHHEGYVKLLVTDLGRAIAERPNCKVSKFIDNDGYICNNVFKEDWLSNDDPDVEILYSRTDTALYKVSGPALSNLKPASKGFTYDFVRAFPCDDWPSIAGRWFKRPRDANWPSEELMQEIIRDGCAVVPVGFYTCPEQAREWRLSFNLSERKLSMALSRNQRTCYCLVKLLLKSQLSKQSILSSYMIKNMMFWFCEQRFGVDEWADDCLGLRIMQFIGYICLALEHHNLPHYFLPRNTLISHKSAEEVKSTLEEIKALEAKPMTALFQVCRELQCFQTQGQFALETADENRKGIILYVAIAQALYQLGMLNIHAKQLAVRCFRAVVGLNTSQFMPLKRTNVFASSTVPQLLKPIAVYNMQTGQVDQAIALYQIMLDSDKEIVEQSYPETLTNLGCLYANKVDLVKDMKGKKECADTAEKFFLEALKHTSGSPSLHLAYGNFLNDKKRGVGKAVEQFKSAISTAETRVDDDALIQIAVPGKTKIEYVPGKVVAFYLLIVMLVDLDKLFEARQYAAKYESYVQVLPLKHRSNGYDLCAISYQKTGLKVKAQLAKEEARQMNRKHAG